MSEASFFVSSWIIPTSGQIKCGQSTKVNSQRNDWRMITRTTYFVDGFVHINSIVVSLFFSGSVVALKLTHTRTPVWLILFTSWKVWTFSNNKSQMAVVDRCSVIQKNARPYRHPINRRKPTQLDANENDGDRQR